MTAFTTNFGIALVPAILLILPTLLLGRLVQSCGTRNRQSDSTLSPTLSKIARRMGGNQTAALVLFVYLILKVLIVSRGDLVTSMGILKAAGPVPVLVGGIVSALPILSALGTGLLVYCLAAGTWPYGPTIEESLSSSSSSLPEWLGAYGLSLSLTASVFLSAFLAPLLLLGAVLIWAISAARFHVVESHRAKEPYLRQFGGNGRARKEILLLISSALVLATVFMAMYGMWLPHESLQLGGEHKALIGSVLDESGKWITVLVSGKRTLAHVPVASVEERTPCQPGDIHFLNNSVVALLAASAHRRLSSIPLC